MQLSAAIGHSDTMLLPVISEWKSALLPCGVTTRNIPTFIRSFCQNMHLGKEEEDCPCTSNGWIAKDVQFTCCPQHTRHASVQASPFQLYRFSACKVIHSSIGVLTIILQQHKHQMPSQPRPLGMTIDRETSRITYYGQHVIKEVPESMFTQMHWSVLTAVYTFLLKHHGPQASQGLIRPMANPQLKHNTWRVKLPLGSPFLPRAQGSLQNCVRDVLLGLQALHAAGFVHCDIRLPNIIEVSHTSHSVAHLPAE